MQPVEPSTMVRGPAALTMSFMTRADSQPWQVTVAGGEVLLDRDLLDALERLEDLRGVRECRIGHG
jgi:hypothetical protein